jgi:hypothetical protein
MIIFNIVLIL